MRDRRREIATREQEGEMGRVEERSKTESEKKREGEREMKGSEESATDFDDLHRQ